MLFVCFPNTYDFETTFDPTLTAKTTMTETTPSSAARIAHLCDSWIAAVQRPDGGMGIGGNTEQFRLLRNGISFHDLTYEELRAACLGLGRVLLLRGLNTVIDFDHLFFWSWCAEILLSRESPAFTPAQRELAELYGTSTRTALANAKRPAGSKEDFLQQRDNHRYIPFHLNEMGHHAHLILAYLSFPLLEGVTKQACAEYVDFHGTVLRPFDAPRTGGSPRHYTVDKRCSSLRDLLHLLHAYVASPSLKSAIDEYSAHLEVLDDAMEPFDLLHSWRNSSLHGQASYPTIGGTVFNIATLILLDRVSAQYAAVREFTWTKVQWELRSAGTQSDRSPSSYYPPF